MPSYLLNLDLRNKETLKDLITKNNAIINAFCPIPLKS